MMARAMVMAMRAMIMAVMVMVMVMVMVFAPLRMIAGLGVVMGRMGMGVITAGMRFTRAGVIMGAVIPVGIMGAWVFGHGGAFGESSSDRSYTASGA